MDLESPQLEPSVNRSGYLRVKVDVRTDWGKRENECGCGVSVNRDHRCQAYRRQRNGYDTTSGEIAHSNDEEWNRRPGTTDRDIFSVGGNTRGE